MDLHISGSSSYLYNRKGASMINYDYAFTAIMIIPLFLTAVIFFIDGKSADKTANTIRVATLGISACLALNLLMLSGITGDKPQDIAVNFLFGTVNMEYSIVSLSFMAIMNTIILIAIFAIRNQKISFSKESVALILLTENVANMSVSVNDIALFYIILTLMFFLLFMIIVIRNKHQQKLNLHRVLSLHLFFLTIAMTAAIYIATKYGTTDIKLLKNIVFTETENKILFWTLSLPLIASMSIFPFHSWFISVNCLLTNTYRLLLSLNIVISGFAFIKYITPVFNDDYEESTLIMQIIGIVSMFFASACMTYGNNLVRKMNYLLIALSSYILIAIFSDYGNNTYIMMLIIGVCFEITAFSEVISIIKNRFGTSRIDALSGLKTVFPGLNIFFVLLMLSLANIPLSINFVGNFMILQKIMQTNLFIVIMIIIGHIYIGTSVISLYRRLFLGAPLQKDTAFTLDKHETFILSLSLAVIYFFGIFPYMLINKIGN